MYTLQANEFGAPIDPYWVENWMNFHRLYDGINLYLFDTSEEKELFINQNYPPKPMPQFTWDIPSNATVVEHKEYGLPLDDKWLNYPRFFRGDVLFVFNTIEEFDQYISDRTDKTDYGDQ